MFSTSWQGRLAAATRCRRSTPQSELDEKLRPWIEYAQKRGVDDLAKLDAAGSKSLLAETIMTRMPPPQILEAAIETGKQRLAPSSSDESRAVLLRAYRQFKAKRVDTPEKWVEDLLAALLRDNRQEPSSFELQEALHKLQTPDAWLPKSPAVVAAYRTELAHQLHRLKMIERLQEIYVKALTAVGSRGVSDVA